MFNNKVISYPPVYVLTTYIIWVFSNTLNKIVIAMCNSKWWPTLIREKGVVIEALCEMSIPSLI